jgi:DNA-binding MarR family transcriptional regulator
VETELIFDHERDFLAALSSCQSISTVAESTTLSPRIVAGALRSIRLILAANDGLADDFLTLIENWHPDGIEGFLLPEHPSPAPDAADTYVRSPDGLVDGGVASQQKNTTSKKNGLIAGIERDWSPQEMRDLGASLLRLADALDQEWNPEAVQSSYQWPSAARQIERNSLELAKKATLIKRQLMIRKQHLPDAFLGEPAWNMLLELFCQFAGSASVSTKSLCIAAECPESTALRHIERMEEAGLIRRFRSRADGRVTLVELTKRGIVGVGRVLERIAV